MKTNGITPVGIEKSVQDILEGSRRMPTKARSAKERRIAEEHAAFSEDVAKLTPAALARKIDKMETQMVEHAKNLEFEEAARLRDQVTQIKQLAFIS